jgi:hypothetical protein
MNSSTRARALTLDLPLSAIEPVLKEWATFFWEDRTPALVYQSLSEQVDFNDLCWKQVTRLVNLSVAMTNLFKFRVTICPLYLESYYRICPPKEVIFSIDKIVPPSKSFSSRLFYL